MTKSEHERERRAFYDTIATGNPVPLTSYCNLTTHTKQCHELATAKLAERDKVFPAPAELKPLNSEDPCADCKHEKLDGRREPCISCNIGGTGCLKWEPA